MIETRETEHEGQASRSVMAASALREDSLTTFPEFSAARLILRRTLGPKPRFPGKARDHFFPKIRPASDKWKDWFNIPECKAVGLTPRVHVLRNQQMFTIKRRYPTYLVDGN